MPQNNHSEDHAGESWGDLSFDEWLGSVPLHNDVWAGEEEPSLWKENRECKGPGHVLGPVREQKPEKRQRGEYGQKELRFCFQ